MKIVLGTKISSLRWEAFNNVWALGFNFYHRKSLSKAYFVMENCILRWEGNGRCFAEELWKLKSFITKSSLFSEFSFAASSNKVQDSSWCRLFELKFSRRYEIVWNHRSVHICRQRKFIFSPYWSLFLGAMKKWKKILRNSKDAKPEV